MLYDARCMLCAMCCEYVQPRMHCSKSFRDSSEFVSLATQLPGDNQPTHTYSATHRSVYGIRMESFVDSDEMMHGFFGKVRLPVDPRSSCASSAVPSRERMDVGPYIFIGQDCQDDIISVDGVGESATIMVNAQGWRKVRDSCLMYHR